MQCTQGFNVTVHKSPNGFYKGTKDEDGFPNCRVSSYYKKREDAEEARFDRTEAMDVVACNQGKGCFACTK